MATIDGFLAIAERQLFGVVSGPAVCIPCILIVRG
jgi:hypothetical protein